MYEKLIRQIRACMDENIPCEEANCGYAPFSKDEDCIDNLMHRAVNAIEELIKVIQNRGFLESLIKPRWVSVTERLPDESGNYLTIFGNGRAIAVNEFMHPRDWLTEEGREAHPNGKWYWGGVTHWMPLPEPPKEET